MSTTSAGNPYVESSDLVANYPATSLALANRLDKYAVNPFADAAARDAAIPTPVQGQLAQTLDDNKVWRYDGTAWAPFSGAVSAANFTDTATGTYTDAGIDYKYITYSGTANITFDQAGFADVLIVGGGGGGGSGRGGGGGGGMVLWYPNYYVPAQTMIITIGAGGAGAFYSGSRPGQNGIDSMLRNRVADPPSVLTATGGGGGANIGSVTNANGSNGANGGGGSGSNADSGGSGNAVGFAGGIGSAAGTGYPSGGGGGANQIGGNATSGSQAGNGGDGLPNSITNVSQTFGGGGGGGIEGGTAGAGGAGGGGAGSSSGAGTAGTANTGGGAGGTATTVDGSNGGSGICIVRVVV